MKFLILRLLASFLLSSSFVKAQLKSELSKPKLAVHGLDISKANFFQDNKMNSYDIKYLKLDITVQPKSKFIVGNCYYRVLVKEVLDTFAIEFKQSMGLDSVFINNVKQSFSRGNDHIYIALNSPAPAGTFLNFSFHYKGSVAAGFYAGTDATGLDFTASVSESFQAREWFPAKQLLNDKIDSTDMWITTGAAFKAGSNGLLKEVVDLPNNLKQYRWACRYPLNYYMPSIAVGNYLEYNLYAKPAAIFPDSVLVQNYIYNSAAFLSQNKSRLDKTARFLEKFSDLFGIYPFYKEKYGHAQADIGGGMEHATMSTMKDFEEHLVAHELAHQWFGDNVTCATWNDIWLNESFATYSQYLMVENLPALFPGSAAQTMIDFHRHALEPGGSVYVPAADSYNESRIFNYRLSYAKGASAIHNLRFEFQNDTLFFNALKKYQRQYGNSFAATSDFKFIAEQVSGRNLTDFFSQKIYGEGYPTYHVTYLKHGLDTLILQISQTTSSPTITPFFAGLVEYKISSAQGDTIIKLNHTSKDQSFSLYYTKTPSGVEVDPNNWVLNGIGNVREGVSTLPVVVKDITVYPNPVVGKVSVRMPANIYNSMSVVSIDGRVIAKHTIPLNTTLFTKNLQVPGGTYFLYFRGTTSSSVRKIIVIGK